MSFLPKLRRVLDIRERKGSAEAARDVEEEIRFHLESRVRHLMAREALDREAAEARARAEFGDLDRAKRALRRQSRGAHRRLRLRENVEALVRDLRLALRRLRRRPGFTAAAALTLALGIGATTAIFSVVNGVLLKPLPFTEPARLVALWHTMQGEGRGITHQSDGTYFTYREENRVFEDVGLWDNLQVTVTGLAEPERVDGLLVTDGLLPLLGVNPALGRMFTPEDDTRGTPLTAILGHAYWQRRFGGDPDVIGRTITLNGTSLDIIGVTPERFRFMEWEPAVLVPARLDRSQARIGRFNYQAIARLRPGVTLEQAEADLERMLPLAVEKFPRGLTLERIRAVEMTPLVRPLKADIVGDVDTALWLVFGAVGIVLLIACANVANLFLVRAESRHREVAVRTALGAGRGGVAREFLLEGLGLGLLGGAGGLALAFGGLELLQALGPESLPRLEEIGLTPSVLGFGLGITLLSALAFSLLPALKYTRPDLVTSLKEGGRGGGEGRKRNLSRHGLAVAQVSLALVLLIGSGLMIRSFQALRNVSPGFERPEEVLTFGLLIPSSEIADRRAVARAQEEIVRRLGRIPGVVSAATVNSVAMDGRNNNNSTYVEGFSLPEGEAPPSRRHKFASPGYFETMGNPVLAGRSFTWADVHNLSTVAVVTERFAREYWDNPAQAIGKRIREGREGPWKEIVGVVGNVYDDGVDRGPTGLVYWPLLVADFWGTEIFPWRSTIYVVRAAHDDPESLLPQAREAVWSVNPNLPLAPVRTLEAIYRRSTARTSFVLLLLTIAAAVALILGIVGLYGVISYSVSTRTREIGIRVAIGARHADVTGMVIRQGLLLAAIGVAVGLAGAAALTRLMEALLFGTGAVDPSTYAATSIGLVAVAFLASYLPARRAASIDPMQALRHE